MIVYPFNCFPVYFEASSMALGTIPSIVGWNLHGNRWFGVIVKHFLAYGFRCIQLSGRVQWKDIHPI